MPSSIVGSNTRGRPVTSGLSDDRKFECPYCHAAYHRLEHKNRHVLTVHEKDKGRVKCEFCDYATARKDNLQAHQWRMHGK